MLGVIVLTLFGGVKRLNALGCFQPKNVIVVELRYGREQDILTFRVPIVENPKDRRSSDERIEAGCWAFTGRCDENLGCEYCVFFMADGAGEGMYNVMADLSFRGQGRERCNTHKEFTVARGKPTELKARCGMTLRAFYEQ